MKKILILFMIMISFCSLSFAYEPKTKYINIKGFLEEEETNLIFNVWKDNSNSSSDRIYNTGNIYVNDLNLREVTVFNWELMSNKEINVFLKFTITPLQAFLNGTYFVPKHTVKMYDGLLVKSHDFSNAKTGNSSYPGYRQSNSGAGTFIINSAEFIYNETISNSFPKSGYCTIQIFNYDNVTAGNFDYSCFVTVEFSTQ